MMSTLRISIAMCTYNGKMYLQEQLDSIVCQSRLPDELVVCDDNSSDQTLFILENFSTIAPFPVRIFRNKVNIGSTKNFEKAIILCEGDIISLSDQDDIWNTDKLSLMENVFKSSPNIGAVFSNGTVVSEDLTSLGYTLWEAFNFKKRNNFTNRMLFELLLNHNVVTGATLAFRSNLRNMLVPIPLGWVHDEWIALVVTAVSKITAIDKPLVKYRQHGENQIGAVKINLAAKTKISKGRDLKLNVIKCNEFKNRLLKYSNIIDQSVFNKIRAKVSHLNTRIRLRTNLYQGFLPGIMEFLMLNYNRYSNGSRSFIADICYKNAFRRDAD